MPCYIINVYPLHDVQAIAGLFVRIDAATLQRCTVCLLCRTVLGACLRAVVGTTMTVPNSRAALDVAMRRLVAGLVLATSAASSSRGTAGAALAALPTAWDPVVPPWTAGCRAIAVAGGTRSALSPSTGTTHLNQGLSLTSTIVCWWRHGLTLQLLCFITIRHLSLEDCHSGSIHKLCRWNSHSKHGKDEGGPNGWPGESPLLGRHHHEPGSGSHAGEHHTAIG